MPDTILVVVEQREGKLNRVSWETITAGQAIAEARTLLLAAERKRVLSGLMARIHGNWAPRTTCLSALHVADCRTVAPRGKKPAPTAG